MRKARLSLIVIIMIGVLAVAIGMFFYSGGVSNSSPTPTPIVTPIPTVIPTTTMTSTPTSTPKATPNPKLTVTYSEFSRNATMIVIYFKLEPNSYIFQLNAASFYLIESGNKVSSNLNDVVIIGTQYSILYFSINNYNGINYTMSSNVLTSDTSWIRQ